MKVKSGLLLVLLCGFTLLSACGKDETSEGISFLATLVEQSDNSVLVAPLEGESIRQSADRLSFDSSHLEDIGAQAGDVLRVTYTGSVRESYPAGIDVLRWSLEEPTQEIPSNDRTRLSEEPPALFVSYGTERKTALLGSSTWQHFDAETKSFIGIARDTLHPLQSKALLPRFDKTAETKITLLPTVRPDTWQAAYWSASLLGETKSIPTPTPLALSDDGTLTLPEQAEGCIIKIHLTWENEGSTTSYGDASYSIWLAPQKK